MRTYELIHNTRFTLIQLDVLNVIYNCIDENSLNLKVVNKQVYIQRNRSVSLF